jgi:antitoxin component of MazEF toxin-antitoxin module
MDLNAQTGHEQTGHRPALIISPERYNRRVELSLICPITSRVKGFPFEVGIPDGRDVAGVAERMRRSTAKPNRTKLRYSLDELVAGITPENRQKEFDWGPSVGREFTGHAWEECQPPAESPSTPK